MRESSTEYGAVPTTDAELAIVAQLTQKPPDRSIQTQFQPGHIPVAPYKPHPLDKALLDAVDRAKLAAVVVGLAMKGQPWAIKMIYDRLAGLPVQRLEAKLLAAVQDDARRISKEQGIPYEDVLATAKRLAQGT